MDIFTGKLTVSPGEQCGARIYSFGDPCVGPHHVCVEAGDHHDHECFCGFMWTQEDIEDALSLDHNEWVALNRGELAPADVADKIEEDS